MTTHAKKVVQVLKHFLSFMLSFPSQKVKQYIGNDVTPSLQEVGVAHAIYWHGEDFSNYK